MARPDRFIKIAYDAAAGASPGCSFHVGAAVAKGNKLLASGACTTKTHPQNPKLKSNTNRNQLCAEFITILRALHFTESLHRCSIYIARRRRDTGEIAIARPCSFCQEFMSKAGIKDVYYTNRDGQIERMEI